MPTLYILKDYTTGGSNSAKDSSGGVVDKKHKKKRRGKSTLKKMTNLHKVMAPQVTVCKVTCDKDASGGDGKKPYKKMKKYRRKMMPSPKKKMTCKGKFFKL